MLKKETIQSLAKLAGIDPQEFEEKIKSENEEDISLKELKVFTPEEFDTRLTNEKKTSYLEGKDAGKEMWVKDKKKEFGYDFEGTDLDTFLEKHNEKLQASSEKPDEKVLELKKDIERLNQTHQQALQERETKLSDFQRKFNQTVISNKLLNIVPAETTIPKEDVITLFNNYYQTELSEDGRTIVKKNGEVLKDPTTASERELKDVFTEFITERKYVKQTPGRGGDNEFGNGGGVQTKSVSEFQEKWQKKTGKTLNDPQFEKDYMAWRKENKEVTD